MMVAENDAITVLEEVLRQGLRLSRQGSYQRRAPAADSVPFLVRARDGLQALTSQSPTNSHAWKLLSLAHEALLDYGLALNCQQEFIRQSGRSDKRELKRLALLRQVAVQWSEMPLSPVQLAELGVYLRKKLCGGMGDRTLRWTETWLAEQGIPQPERVVTALRKRGGFTDFQVFSNVVT